MGLDDRIEQGASAEGPDAATIARLMEAMLKRMESMESALKESAESSAGIERELRFLRSRVSDIDSLQRSRAAAMRAATHRFSSDLSPTGAAFVEGPNDLHPSSPAAQ